MRKALVDIWHRGLDRLLPTVPPWSRRGTARTMAQIGGRVRTSLSLGRAADPGPETYRIGQVERHEVGGAFMRSISSPPDFPLLMHESYESEPPTFLRFQEAIVFPAWGIVEYSPGHFLDESLRMARWAVRYNGAVWRDPRDGRGRLPGMTLAGEAIHSWSPLTLSPRRRKTGHYLLLNHYPSHNYGHFLSDCLPGLVVWRRELQDGHLRVLCRPLLPWQRDLITALGVPMTSIEQVDADRIVVQDILFPLALTGHYSAYAGSVNRQTFKELRERNVFLAETVAAGAPRRIYVSRASRAGSRRMIGEEKLVEALVARGFAVVDPGALTVREQIARFASARIVIGPLGAGMANVGYAPPGCQVIEIMPRQSADTWLAHLCVVMGHRFGWIIAETRGSNVPQSPDRPPPLDYDYEVDIEAVIKTVDAATRSMV